MGRIEFIYVFDDATRQHSFVGRGLAHEPGAVHAHHRGSTARQKAADFQRALAEAIAWCVAEFGPPAESHFDGRWSLVGHDTFRFREHDDALAFSNRWC
ncbi:hypothetical protein SLNSH_07450 [Alsobacter soli]|uniref:Uncharacterized protein n=1 Tax=Alsobacter soli TaxID=2109933 RepID=A0A2T1HVW7_9HYPH|nr:hypothetical protein [Alsobacter soli]PSC05802.1 hypothetical protein SLNSH_07450 [Alsobacter soli]